MPKVKVDYSNTIFYKIYCKDTSIQELYIGHTTNFVQRKYGHKQGCINPKSPNYKCKLYNVIRNNMGWDNWKMEIIAFHNCEDLYSAKKQEQYYFEKYNATLNSVEPLPPLKPISIVDKIPREPLYCKTCKLYFNTRKSQDEHNKRPRHIKLLQGSIENDNISSNKYICEKCNYKCCKNSEFQKHLKTNKHNATSNTMNVTYNSLICKCGKEYKHTSSFYRHKKLCKHIESKEDVEVKQPSVDTTIVIELLKQNQEFKDLMIEQMIEQSRQNNDFQKQLLDVVKDGKIINN